VKTYALLIYGDESAPPAPETSAGYQTFTDEARAAGVFKAGEGLDPTNTATTVRVRSGERMLTDGPFAETREALGGFYLLEVEDLDAALEWAAKIPGASSGCVEVRPLIDYEAFAARAAAAGAGASA
jgi:hypothetical protein